MCQIDVIILITLVDDLNTLAKTVDKGHSVFYAILIYFDLELLLHLRMEYFSDKLYTYCGSKIRYLS